MRVKPHGTWYLLPVMIVGIGFFVLIYQFFSAILGVAGEATVLELNQIYEVEMMPDTEIALYVERTALGTYEFHDLDGTFLINYRDFYNDVYSIEVFVQKLPNGAALEGYEFESIGMFDVELEDEIINFADIQILEEGSYQVIFQSEDDVDLEFGVTTLDATGIKQNVTEMGITIVSTSVLSTLSFLFILIKRSKSKKTVSAENQYSKEYYARLEKQRMNEENNSNRY